MSRVLRERGRRWLWVIGRPAFWRWTMVEALEGSASRARTHIIPSGSIPAKKPVSIPSKVSDQPQDSLSARDRAPSAMAASSSRIGGPRAGRGGSIPWRS